MSAIVQSFLYPVSPVLAVVAAGTGLIAAECLPGNALRGPKFLLALSGAVLSVTFSLWLWALWPASAVVQGQAAAGAWLVEFTRSYRLDPASLALFVAIGVFTFFSLVFMRFQFEDSDVRSEIFALTLFVAAGMMILVSARNLLMVFLGLELLSLPTYVLVGIHRKDRLSCEAALKYFLFGSFATVLLVFGIALLYAAFGSLDMSVLAERIAAAGSGANMPLLVSGLSLILIAVGFKAGLVPFHMWVPDAYQGAPSAVTGFMGSAVKLAAFGLSVRVLWDLCLPISGRWADGLSLLAVLTMFVGNLAALAQDNLKRMFAYSSISHAGFLFLGVAVFPADGPSLDPLYYYLVVYGLMFLGLLACIAFIERGAKSVDIFQISGMGFTHPLFSLCLALFALSGAGIPPTAGFFAKYFLFLQVVDGGKTGLVVLALLASLVGVYYYLRVVVYLYMKEPKGKISLPKDRLAFACIIACALLLLYFAVVPDVPGIFGMSLR